MKKLLFLVGVGVFLIVGLLSYQFVVVPIMASVNKATKEKYSDCIKEGIQQRVSNHQIINWIGSNADQVEDLKVCANCRKKLGIPYTREMLEVGDRARDDFYNGKW